MLKKKLFALLTVFTMVISSITFTMPAYAVQNVDIEAVVSGEQTECKIKNIIFMIPDGGGDTLKASLADDDTVYSTATINVVEAPIPDVVVTVNYDTHGGTAITAQTYTYNPQTEAYVQFPENPTKENYTFKGWSTTLHGEVINTENVAITENDVTTYYAVWEMKDTAVSKDAVYISEDGCNDCNNGRNAKYPIKTLAKAATIINADENIDKIVVVTRYSKTDDGASLNNYLNGLGRKITITGYDTESVFDARYIEGGSNKDSHFRFGTDIEFKNIKLYGSSKDGGFMSQGYELTFGEGVTLAGGSQNVGFLHYNSQLKDGGVVNLMSGQYSRIDLGVQSDQTYRGTSTINIGGTAITKITNGHGWKGTQSVYGIQNVNINGGNVTSIQLSSTAENAVTNYAGLRYFTINAGTVGNINITGSSVSGIYDTEKYQTATARAGVTVVEINGGTVGTIGLGKNVQTGADDPDDATRVVILNNGMNAIVTDTDAIVVKTTGGTLSAATNAQETYPANYKTIDSNWGKAIVLKGFTYVLPEDSTANAVKIDGGEPVLLTDYAGGVITGIEAAGEHTVEFVTVEAEVGTKVFLSNSGSDENDGFTADSPVLTLAKVQEILAANEEIVNVVIVGAYTYKTGAALGVAGREITVSGADADAVLNFNDPAVNDEILTLKGDVILKNIKFSGSTNDGRIEARANTLTLGEGFVRINNNGENSHSVVAVAVGSNDDATINVESGFVSRLFPGYFNGGNYFKTATVNISGENTTVDVLALGHNWRSYTDYHGVIKANITDGAKVNNLKVQANGTGTSARYSGLRYYTIDNATVGTIITTGKPKQIWDGGSTEATAENRTGITVFEFNNGATVTNPIAHGGGADNSTRIVIFNDGTKGTVTDEGAITIVVTGGAIKADVTATVPGNERASAVLNGYSFTTDKPYIAITDKNGNTKYYNAANPNGDPAATLSGETVSGIIPADYFAVGVNRVVFTDGAQAAVSFVDENTTKSELQPIGGSVSFPTASEIAGYTFVGWSKTENGEVISDLTSEKVAYEGNTYYAIYTINKYTIKFVNADGTELQSSEVAYGTTPIYTGETPTKASDGQYTYTFAGWDSEIVAVTEAVTYTAQYTSAKRSYTITWLNDDGSTIDTTTVEYGTVPTAPALTKAGYTLSWDKEIVAVTEAVTYTAVWTKNDPVEVTSTLTVKFAREDGATPISFAKLYIYEDNTKSKLVNTIELENSETDTAEITVDITLTEGTYYAEVVKNGYLTFKTEVIVTATAISIGEIKLIPGDIKGSYDDECGDGVVDIDDFIRVLRGFSTSTSEDLRKTVDINEDGVVSVRDLAYIKANFEKGK